jgi:large subunit ribosomal protein L5
MAKAKESSKKETKKIAKSSVDKSSNPMRNIFIEKLVLSCGATGQDLEKAKKLLELLSTMKAEIVISQKRIPDFNVRPGLEVGTRVTIRGEKAIQLLRRLLAAEDNTLKRKQVADNHFSFGIKEYIEIPGVEYHRDIGIRGLNITIDFARAGLRVKRKKIKAGHVPKRQFIPKEEIIKFMEDNFKTKFE